jgi:hypothetical protein
MPIHLNFTFGIPLPTNGVDGTNGTNGIDGTEGKSAYQTWLDAGNTGTEQDFLDYLAVQAAANITASATVTELPAGSTHTVTITANPV